MCSGGAVAEHNLARKVGRAGGEISYEWAIWHVPHLYFEAEHHGVWRSRQGAMINVPAAWASPEDPIPA